MTVDGFPEYYSLRSYVSGGNLCLNLQEIRFSAVARWTYGEVDPMAASLVALYEELIIIALRAVRDIQQDRSIADGLFESRHMDVHRAARQMIARRTPASQPIHLRRTVARVDHQSLRMVQRVIAVP